jgi:hypothetical protein
MMVIHMGENEDLIIEVDRATLAIMWWHEIDGQRTSITQLEAQTMAARFGYRLVISGTSVSFEYAR